MTSQRLLTGPFTQPSRALRRRKHRARAAQSVDVERKDDATPSESIALESVDIVAMPGPVADAKAIADSLDLASWPAPAIGTPQALGVPLEQDVREDLEDGPSTGGFQLDKTQSFWLLNLVSLLYGTNTTVRSRLWFRPSVLQGPQPAGSGAVARTSDTFLLTY